MMIPAWVAQFADIASLLGFLITVWILLQTTSIKRYFVLRVRVPESRQSLEKISSALLQNLHKWPDSQSEIGADLARAQAVLMNLSRKLPRKEGKLISELLQRIGTPKPRILSRKYPEQKATSKDELWEVYNKLQGVIESLNQTEQDSRWG
ncbi:MAG: hypothetical protein U1F76_14600 [Candidatus Competibacteraceae bacterium]